MNKLLDYLPFESLRSGILAAVLIPGILLSLVGWIIGEHVSSLMLNLGTELIGAWFTYVLLNVLLGRFEEQEQERRHQARRQQQLVQNLRSQVDHVARHAMEEIVLEGWHQKGFLKGANLIKANLRGLDISFASLEEVLLFEAHLEGAQFVGAKLRNAYLGSAFLNGQIFRMQIWRISN